MSNKIPADLERRVLVRDGYRCVYCQRGGPTFEDWANLCIDHFIPESKGGLTNVENLVTACHNCNTMKAAYSFADIPAATKDLLTWWADMRRKWDTFYAPGNMTTP